MMVDNGRRSAGRAGVALTLTILPSLTALASTIVVYGATGNIGSKIVSEALNRGHEVIGVSRNPETLAVDHLGFSAVEGDVNNLESMLEIVSGVDVVIMSVRGYGPNNFPEETTNNRSSLTFIRAARQLGEAAPRVIHLGGGSTLSRDGVLLLDTREVEEGTVQHGLPWGHWLTLQNYRATTAVKWTVISPSGGYNEDGVRTGVYRQGWDEVLINEDGRPGGISHEDLAVAIVDEIESPRSIRRRMTVGY